VTSGNAVAVLLSVDVFGATADRKGALPPVRGGGVGLRCCQPLPAAGWIRSLPSASGAACKTVAKASEVRIHPATRSTNPPDLGELDQGPILLVRPSPVECGHLRAVHGNIAGTLMMSWRSYVPAIPSPSTRTLVEPGSGPGSSWSALPHLHPGQHDTTERSVPRVARPHIRTIVEEVPCGTPLEESHIRLPLTCGNTKMCCA